MYDANHDNPHGFYDNSTNPNKPDDLGLKYSDLVYNGFWFSPEMDLLRNSMDFAQRTTTGYVDVQLHKGNLITLNNPK